LVPDPSRGNLIINISLRAREPRPPFTALDRFYRWAYTTLKSDLVWSYWDRKLESYGEYAWSFRMFGQNMRAAWRLPFDPPPYDTTPVLMSLSQRLPQALQVVPEHIYDRLGPYWPTEAVSATTAVANLCTGGERRAVKSVLGLVEGKARSNLLLLSRTAAPQDATAIKEELPVYVQALVHRALVESADDRRDLETSLQQAGFKVGSS
jgi:hypothetical protein